MNNENNMLTAEEIQENWELFKKSSLKVGDYDDRLKRVTKMLERYEDRFSVCPASANTSYHCAYVGGLVEHTLNVLKFALKISTLVESTVSKESIFMSALFHDLGKIGDDTSPYYVPHDDWHRKKGMVYRINPKIQYMPVAQRSLFLLQLNGIKLTEDEFSAILIHDGQYLNENKSWAMKEPTLALILHHADVLSNKKEKGEL